MFNKKDIEKARLNIPERGLPNFVPLGTRLKSSLRRHQKVR
jgi:hypothetical protein